MDELYNDDDAFGGVALSDDDTFGGDDEGEELEGLDDEVESDDDFGGDDEDEE